LGTGSIQAAPIAAFQLDQLDAQAPIERLGTMTIPQGLLVIEGRKLEISSLSTDGLRRQTILSGQLLKVRPQVINDRLELRAVVYFDGGSWLSKIVDRAAMDIIFLEGGFARGLITSAGDQGLVISSQSQNRNIDWQQIRDIRCARIYRLVLDGVLPTFGGNSLGNINYSFTPTFAVNRLDSQSIMPAASTDDDDDE